VDDGFEMIGAKMPCVITVTKPSYDPRYPTIKSKMAANRKEIGTITADDITNIDRERIGLKGSPTKVKKTFTPAVKVGGVKINEDTNEASAKKLFETLCADGII
ncbi:MAG: electron transfer flavoprotein subunit beta, partial [Oscillospiraceae bacterium]